MKLARLVTKLPMPMMELVMAEEENSEDDDKTNTTRKSANGDRFLNR